MYVDDLLVLLHQPVEIMKIRYYRLKDGYEKPTRYLGAEIIEWKFPDSANITHWGLSSVQYVKEAL